MGYYTIYKLTVIDLKKDPIYETCIEKSLTEEFEFLDTDLEVSDIKWYEHEEELKQFSSNYPNVLFILTGIGEEHYFSSTTLTADIWIKYFLNGKSYTDKLNYKFPEFNKDKLC